MIRGARIGLGAGLGLAALALVVTLTRAPASVARTNDVPDASVLASVYHTASACQGEEELPRDTSAIRLSLQAVIGPQVTVRLLLGGRVLARGERGSGWTAGSVTVPLSSPTPGSYPVTVCYTIGPTRGPIAVYGAHTSPASSLRGGEGATLGGRMKVEYLRPGTSSWWSRVLPIARRMGLGHAAAGTWLALVTALLVLAMSGLATWLAARELP